MPAKDLLKDKDRRFRLLFEDHPQPMWVVERETGRFLEVNSAASRLYGYSPEQFRDLRLSDLEAPFDTAEGALTAAPGVTVWRHRAHGGRYIDIEAAVHNIQY